MKIIYWNLFGREITFRLNWFEFIVFKRIFKLKKYETHKVEVKGQKLDLVIVDEASNINKNVFNKD